MSNALEKLMQNAKDQEPPVPAGGRPLHDHWYGFKNVYPKGKLSAKCNNCSHTFSNTSKERMSKHR